MVLTALGYRNEQNLGIIERYSNDTKLKDSITDLMLIDIVSFLNEWKRFNNYAKSREDIKETLKITAPLIKRLKSWKGLEGLRNTIIAHGFRDDNNQGQLTCLKTRYFNADVPTTHEEWIMLSECTSCAIKVVLTRHQKEAINASETIPENDTSVNRGISNIEDFEKELNTFKEDICKNDPSFTTIFF